MKLFGNGRTRFAVSCLFDVFNLRRDRAEPAAPLRLPPPAGGKRLEQVLSIPVIELSGEDIAGREAQDRGLFLARQERWHELIGEIRSADLARTTTPGGMPVADLMAYGARSDVINAVEHALYEGVPSGGPPLIDGIGALETLLADLGNDPYMAAIVALAHIDVAWAWRGTGWETIVPRLHRDRCGAHFDRAAFLLEPHCGIELDSPMLMAARCAMLAGLRHPDTRIADDYEDLIDLAPHNQRHMRALGIHLLPRWFGSYADLELEARRTAARTQDVWGAGGYTWVCFDAIAYDEGACARVDVDFFVDGLKDIVRARPDQQMINLLSAYCAVALRGDAGGDEAADLARLRICDAANWLIRDHLTELHPMIWAHAADGFDNNARISSARRFAARGHSDALNCIADMFRDEIAQGLRVEFTQSGPQFVPV